MTKRLDKDRELDVLSVGERLVFVDGVLVIPCEVVRIGFEFTYSDYTAPLGYHVKRDGYTTDEPEGCWASRSHLFRETEHDELLECLVSLRDSLDYTLEIEQAKRGEVTK